MKRYIMFIIMFIIAFLLVITSNKAGAAIEGYTVIAKSEKDDITKKT